MGLGGEEEVVLERFLERGVDGEGVKNERVADIPVVDGGLKFGAGAEGWIVVEKFARNLGACCGVEEIAHAARKKGEFITRGR